MRVLLSIVLSVVFHALCAVCLVFAVDAFVDAPQDIEDVTLEVSELEFSFSEDDLADVALAASATAVESAHEFEKPQEASPVEISAPAFVHVPPEIGDIALPVPDDVPPEKMDLPEKRQRSEIERVDDSLDKAEESSQSGRKSVESEAVDANPPQAALQQAKVDVPPGLRKEIEPKYPKESRRKGEEGSVTLSLMIDASGKVTDAVVERSTGFARLDAAAKEAVLNARFKPAKANGRNVPATARITLDFKLKKRR